MASHGSVIVFETSFSTASNVQHGPMFPPLKRRRISRDDEDHVTKGYATAIDIWPYGSSLLEKSQSLTPITLLPRSRLQLSWLDPCPSASRSIQPGKLFVSSIPSLEVGIRHQREHLVLTARLRHGQSTPSISASLPGDDNGKEELYVIERVKTGIYAICALQHWVGEGDLIVACKGWKPEEHADLPSSFSAGGEDNWVGNARIPEAPECESLGEPPNVTLVFGQGEEMLKGEEVVGVTSSAVELASLYEAVRGEISERKSEDSQNPRDFLDGLKTQYLETLYISKTSVAYFAKGPLSRARAAFQAVDDATGMRASDLCYFYRECIIPVKKMDAKYRDSIPEFVQNLPLDMCTNVTPDTSFLNGKKRKGKKRKLGKDGLYPDEKDLIAKWWRNRQVTETSLGNNSGEDDLKGLVAELRFRETQLQILLILETISLESSLHITEEPMPDAKGQDPASNKVSKKKPQDLGVLLELLADRLCIWHTVSSGDCLLTEAVKGQDKNFGGKAENDILRDFCTEVIISFYASRLPEQCKALSRKLGGPISTSPKRPSMSRQKSTADPTDRSTKKQHAQRSRRTLQRVLTDEQAAEKRPVPSLLRNKTTTGVLEFKRESSEPVPLSLLSSGRGAIQKPKRIDNREVDLDAVAKQHEAKLKRMNMLLEQKKELDAAINALRKPNRELVARDWAKSAAQRSSVGSSRKQKDPIRNPLGEGVQVMATPRGIRKKDCGIVRVPSISKNLEKPSRETVSFEADEQVVPSSTSRPQAAFELSFEGPRTAFNSIQDTPSKPASHLLSGSSCPSKNTESDIFSSVNLTNTPFKVPKLLLRPHPKPPGIENLNPTKSFESKVQNYSKNLFTGHNTYNNDIPIPTGVQETPPRPPTRRFNIQKDSNCASISSPTPAHPVIFSTPVKKATSRSYQSTSGTAGESKDVQLSASNSIYGQLGWDDDDNDDDELSVPWSTVSRIH